MELTPAMRGGFDADPNVTAAMVASLVEVLGFRGVLSEEDCKLVQERTREILVKRRALQNDAAAMAKLEYDKLRAPTPASRVARAGGLAVPVGARS